MRKLTLILLTVIMFTACSNQTNTTTTTTTDSTFVENTDSLMMELDSTEFSDSLIMDSINNF